MNRLLFLLLLFITVAGPLATVSGQAVTDQQLALQYYNNRDFEKAAALFEKLFDEQPSLFNYTYLFQTYLELNETDKAEKLVKQQARRNPDEYRYIIDQGYVLMRDNQQSKATRLFEQAIKDLPANQRKTAELANAFMSRREYDYAARTYLKGRQQLAPAYTFGFELAMLYEIQGNFEKMTEEYLSLMETNPEMQLQIQSRLQNTLSTDPEGTKSEAIRATLLKNVQKSPDNVMLSEMMMWLSIQMKDFGTALIQARALDRRIDENGGRVFALGQLCVSNEDYATASDAFNYVIARSKDVPLVMQSKVELLNAEYQLATHRFPIDKTELLKLEEKFKNTIQETGRNPLVYPLMRSLAHLEAFYLNKPDEAKALLEELTGIAMQDRNFQAECKLELGDIMLFTGEPWEATLLYSQVDKAFKNDPLGHEARFRNGRLSFYIGEFEWARAQLDVLRAATSKLIANDAMALSLLISDNIEDDSSTVALGTYARADLLLYRNKPAEALLVLDSLLQAFPQHSIVDDALMLKAKIYTETGKFSEAEKIYTLIIGQYSDGIYGDDALYKLAQLYENQMGDKEKAMASYEELLVKFPGSLFTVDARKRFRALRGDQVN